MGIATRIETARFLIENNKHADALILILIAVASSARKQYPIDVEKEDNKVFKRFLSTRLNQIISNGYDARDTFGGEIAFISTTRSGKIKYEQSVEELIYEQYRCSFLHEGELPNEVQFSETSPTSDFIDQISYQIKNKEGINATITVLQGNTLVLNYTWLDWLIAVVEGADINADIYGTKPNVVDDGEPKIFITSIKSS